MDANIAKKLADAHEELTGDDEGLTLREDYSGRGMYGEKTAGVVGNLSEFLVAIAYVGITMGKDGIDENECYEFVEAISKLETDNMGRQMIFY